MDTGQQAEGCPRRVRQEVQQPCSSSSSAPDTGEGGRPVTRQQLAGPSFLKPYRVHLPLGPGPKGLLSCPVTPNQHRDEFAGGLSAHGVPSSRAPACGLQSSPLSWSWGPSSLMSLIPVCTPGPSHAWLLSLRRCSMSLIFPLKGGCSNNTIDISKRQVVTVMGGANIPPSHQNSQHFYFCMSASSSHPQYMPIVCSFYLVNLHFKYFSFPLILLCICFYFHTCREVEYGLRGGIYLILYT